MPEEQDNFDIEAFIREIEAFQKKYGYSNAAMGRICGLDRSFFTKIKAGDGRLPAISSFNKVVKALNLDANMFGSK